MLQQVDQVNIQASPAIIAAVLPRDTPCRRGDDGTEDELSDRGVLGRLQMKAGQTAEAEQELRAIMRTGGGPGRVPESCQ